MNRCFRILGTKCTPLVTRNLVRPRSVVLSPRFFSAEILSDEVEHKGTKNAIKRSARLKQRRKQQQRKNKAKVAQLLEQKKGSWMIEKKNRRSLEAMFQKLAARFPIPKIQGELERLRSTTKEPLVVEFQKILQDDSSRLAHLRRAMVQFMLFGDMTVDRSTSQKSVSAEDVEIFMKARERAFKLTWNLTDAKEISGLSRGNHQKLVQARQDRHTPKTESQKKREAQRLVKYLGDQLPPRLYQAVVSLFADFVGDAPSALKTVGRSIERRAPTHYHIIAAEVADFFYLNDGLNYNVVDRDEVIKKSQEIWDAFKLEFVDSLMSLQDELLDSVASHPEALLSNSTPLDDDEEEALVVTREIKMPTTTPDLLSSTTKVDRRFRKPRHATFEAVVLEKDTSMLFGDLSEVARRTVFLDNLPIDITEDELHELYSRCGSVDEIQIYNQRPDLDPGPLSAAKTQELRKKQLESNKGSFRNWRRPRSPVYAKMTFVNENGSQKALVDSLRVFGMIVRRHPVRSIRASDMSRLYLENMPEGFTTMDAEYMLNNEFHPSLLLCLDAGQNNRAVVGSCEVRFPSFELAYTSFRKLQSMDAISHDADISIQWLKTPNDANMWWTRQAGTF
ncbi:hypothetical protein FisN_2Lh209 [Fistulifera solaris]|uniref:RRM domain-containing protein n=1 Tax=Fistulifera solaris TaxID=1519565 RepID=A0A1Z5KFS9_FISSO|nr:hypothetical protein FisN_2Lh209 [Fistulifera solaris]|eukprot:GAX24931.1 hypothetical protein FisN_2Lh209 [Fistulifera solaris]